MLFSKQDQIAMNIFYFDQLSLELKLYLLVGLPTAVLILFVLLFLLRNLLNKQVNDQIEKFAIKAKIPTLMRNRIGVRIQWR